MASRRLIYKFLIDIFLPNSCPICGKVLKWNELLCADCEQKLEFADSENTNKNLPEKVYFDKAFAVTYYENEVKDVIYRLKQGECRNFAEYSSQKLAEILKKDGTADGIDVVTAVPMHRKKKAERGCNQAEILAGYLKCFLKKPKDFKLLKVKADKISQHHLSAVQRQNHAEKLYFVNKKHKDISGKTVLICDDVMTTGSTLNICAKLLKEKCKAKKVYCAVCAKTKFENKSDDSEE